MSDGRGREKPGGVQDGLFDRRPEKARTAPLAERLRPQTLDDVVGQDQALGPGSLVRQLVLARRCPSLIFWGPPGVGKTTIARIVARTSGLRFETLSAVSSGVKELREVVARAQDAWRFEGKGTVLFVDEVHRWSKAQQDALLPQIEDGTLVFLGATTENPSFEVVAPLLSRVRVVVLAPLSESALVALLGRALTDRDHGLGALELAADQEALVVNARLAGGDARAALNILETAAIAASGLPLAEGGQRRIDAPLVRAAAQRAASSYDKGGEAHYDTVSAFIKSMRGSDPDGALYWLARMLEGGEDPLFITRRLVIFASEDVGLADPNALVRTMAAAEAVRFVGLPEAGFHLTQATVDLALAPKSNAAKRAWFAAQADARSHLAVPVPLHLRNAPTPLLKSLGYGEDYLYPHDFPDGVVVQTFVPNEVRTQSRELPYYRPSDREVDSIARFARIAALKAGKPTSREGTSSSLPSNTHSVPASPKAAPDARLDAAPKATPDREAAAKHPRKRREEGSS